MNKSEITTSISLEIYYRNLAPRHMDELEEGMNLKIVRLVTLGEDEEAGENHGDHIIVEDEYRKTYLIPMYEFLGMNGVTNMMIHKDGEVKLPKTFTIDYWQDKVYGGKSLFDVEKYFTIKEAPIPVPTPSIVDESVSDESVSEDGY